MIKIIQKAILDEVILFYNIYRVKISINSKSNSELPELKLSKMEIIQ